MKLGRYSLWMIAIAAIGGCHKADEVAAAPAPAAAAAVKDPWAAAPAPVVKDPLRRPLLWSATKDGKTTYLLGTIHVGVDAEKRMPDLVWKDFDAEPTFAMETDTGSIDIGALARTDHGTLHADLGDVYWKKLEDVLTPPVAAAIDNQKPAVAATMLSMHGVPQTPPMDELFLARAQNAHKQIVFLEPATKQLALLEKWMNVRALKENLDDLDEAKKVLDQTIAAYIAGDDAKMVALSATERADAKKAGYTDAEYDQQMAEMLYDRNASWIAGIEKLHAAGGGFVAVGALHLVGKRSVLELLAKAGFTITRVTP